MVQFPTISLPSRTDPNQALPPLEIDIPNDATSVQVSVTGDNGTNAQIAKIHVSIRQLANDLGYSFSEMKLLVKRKAGLCFNKNGTEYCKSFGDCSKEELNSVIQEIIELGDEVGSNLR